MKAEQDRQGLRRGKVPGEINDELSPCFLHRYASVQGLLGLGYSNAGCHDEEAEEGEPFSLRGDGHTIVVDLCNRPSVR